MSKESRVDEIRSRFRNEVDEHLRAATSLVKQFSANRSSVDNLIAAARHLHAVKGTAPVVGARAISDLARAVEECLKGVVGDPEMFTSSLSKIVHKALKFMHTQTAEFVEGKPISDGRPMIATLRSLVPSSRLEDDVLVRIESLSVELKNSIGESQRIDLRREISQQQHISVLTFKPRNAQEDLAKLRPAIAAFGRILSIASTADGTVHALIVSEREATGIQEHLSGFGARLVEIDTEAEPAGDQAMLLDEIMAPDKPDAARDAGKHRVLFVDDSAVSRDLFRIFLKRNGFETETAGDGEEAIAKLKTDRYDAIITDDQMPVMDGIELVKQLRDGGSYTRTPVIVISGQVTEAARAKALNAGANAYLIKGDFAKDQLLKILQEELVKNHRS